MERTAKLFKKGRNQAVILLAEFAFYKESVYIRCDEESNVVLTRRIVQAKSWNNFLHMLVDTDLPDTF